MKKILLTVLVLAAIAFSACNFLLPEGYRVNAPLASMLFQSSVGAPDAALIASRLQVPEGFSIGLFAENVPFVRFMRPTATGDLLVSTPKANAVQLLFRDADGDGRSDGEKTLVADLLSPHGLDLHGGWLYIAEGNAIARIRFDEATRETSGELERVVTTLPAGGNHWSRTVRFGPDGGMYVSVGSSCNVCEESHEYRAAILRFDPDGSNAEVYATGLRNSVGFDWRPRTGELYATDNGRDLLGDDFPPCELNRIVRGGFYGFPYANGDRVPDPDFGAEHPEEVANSRPPAHGFRAHNAPLGISFLRHPGAPDAYRGAGLVALHGSWNRTDKDGYKVVSLHWNDDGSIEERDFAWGFLFEEEVIGRPVDVVEGPDGRIYISDDYAGVVWRVDRAI